MNRKIIITAILILAAGTATCQVVSSCTGHDSIVKKYRKDADRLALQRVYHINSVYKDSVRINKTISNYYLRALIAVYNATAIPARDTVVKMLNIHTDPSTEMNAMSLKASGMQPWMVNLQNYVLPCGQINLDDLISRYYLKIGTYYQSTQYDQVTFTTDTNCNMTALVNNVKTVIGVLGADVGVSFNDVKHITDSVGITFTELVYSYGWGSCGDGCDMRSYWTFRVYDDCSVEYMGRTGLELFTGIGEKLITAKDIRVSPNPVQDAFRVEFGGMQGLKKLALFNVIGQEVSSRQTSESNTRMDIQELPAGIYYLKIKAGENSATFRMIKL